MIIVNDENYAKQLGLAEHYLNEDLPPDLEEWYDELISAIEAYEEDLWPPTEEEIDEVQS